MRTENRIHLHEHDDLVIKDGISDSEIVLEARSLYGDIAKIYLEPTHIIQLRETLKDYTERR